MAAKPANDPRAGHRQRLRDKFSRFGLDKMTDEEIVELLLTFGTPRRDCKQAARQLIGEFGSIKAIFEAEPERLTNIRDVGPINSVAIRFISAVAGRFLEQGLIGRNYLESAKDVLAYLASEFAAQTNEVFKIVFLDSANGVIELAGMPEGIVGAATIHPRALLEKAFKLGASAFVFAHNHPSGRVEPSPADFRVTRQLAHAAFLVEMSVIDHLVVGLGGEYFSFRESGHLARYETEFKYIYHARD